MGSKVPTKHNTSFHWSLAVAQGLTCRRSSKDPRYWVPATKAPTSSAMTRLPSSLRAKYTPIQCIFN